MAVLKAKSISFQPFLLTHGGGGGERGNMQVLGLSAVIKTSDLQPDKR